MGADVNAKDKGGVTPLITATSWARNLEMLKYLISAGADVNAKDDGGDTPFLSLASHPDVECFKYLISKGADPNVKDEDGLTPFHYAARYIELQIKFRRQKSRLNYQWIKKFQEILVSWAVLGV